MLFTGKLTHKTDVIEVGQNGTLKASLVFEEVGTEYPSSIVADVYKEKTERVKTYKVGDTFEVKLNSRANEYNGKRYCSLSAWNIKKLESEQTQQTQQEGQSNMDELPF